jgi:hypothetical protein
VKEYLERPWLSPGSYNPQYPIRSDLKPGDLFRVVQSPTYPGDWAWPDDVLLAVNKCQEVGFFNGGLYELGVVAPYVEVEVLCYAAPKRPGL